MASFNSESPTPPNHTPNSSDTNSADTSQPPLLEEMNLSQFAFVCTTGLYRLFKDHGFTFKEIQSMVVDPKTRFRLFGYSGLFGLHIYPLKLIEALSNRGLSLEEIKSLILDAGIESIDGRHIVVAGSLASEEGREPSVIIDPYSNYSSITNHTLKAVSVTSTPDEEPQIVHHGATRSFRVVSASKNPLSGAGIKSGGFFQHLQIAGGKIVNGYGVDLPTGSPSSVRALADIESQVVPDGPIPSSRIIEIFERFCSPLEAIEPLRSPLEAIGKLDPTTKLIHLFRAYDEEFKSGNKIPDQAQAMMALFGLAAIYFMPETKHLQGPPLDSLTAVLVLAFTGSFAGNQLQGCYPRVAKALDKVATLCMAAAFFTVTGILLPNHLIWMVGLFALLSLGSFIRGLF